jgi:DNA-binding response OmpR family regulator
MASDSFARSSTAASGPEPNTAPLIAIVDDDPRIRKLLTEELEDLGHQCACFTDGFELLGSCATGTWALVLLDLMMPQLDGVECLKRLRAQGFDKPVLIFTALSDNDKRRDAEVAGADEYILKPDLFDNLDTVIERHLSKSGPQANP